VFADLKGEAAAVVPVMAVFYFNQENFRLRGKRFPFQHDRVSKDAWREQRNTRAK
jgi:hypothetical protein